jgi:hypothetical protein
MSGESADPVITQQQFAQAPAAVANTMSLRVTPRCLLVSFTSASDSGAVANRRPE